MGTPRENRFNIDCCFVPSAYSDGFRHAVNCAWADPNATCGPDTCICGRLRAMHDGNFGVDERGYNHFNLCPNMWGEEGCICHWYVRNWQKYMPVCFRTSACNYVEKSFKLIPK